ncbi:hypothetical protein LSAT2_021116 [Lamellibrachia satsuma]|nr:hypothetical protein LSAT2_021116 [Lamellibrachia satsuma]
MCLRNRCPSCVTVPGKVSVVTLHSPITSTSVLLCAGKAFFRLACASVDRERASPFKRSRRRFLCCSYASRIHRSAAGAASLTQLCGQVYREQYRSAGHYRTTGLRRVKHAYRRGLHGGYDSSYIRLLCLVIAVERNSMAAPKYDNRNMVDQGLAAVHAAILNDDVAQLADVCSSGVELNEMFTADINQQHVGMTPMAVACALNKTELAEVLLKHGAHVDFPFAALRTTALMTSAFHGNMEAVTTLLKNGANVRALDMQKSTALGYAFGGTRNLDVIQVLLNAGVDVNQKNVLGMSAMLLVTGYGNDELVAMVLDAGGEPRAHNDFGHTALHLAVVGKKDQLKKMKRLGSIQAAAADRSLNRRNLDLAMQEWARLHRDAVGDTSQESLAKVGQFMMSIGQNLDDDENATDDEDDQEAMKRRVAAVWKHRQEKIQRSKEKKRPAFLATLLACGGGKSRQAADNDSASRPYAAPADNDVSATQPDPNDEVSQLSERFARIMRMLIDAKCEIDATERSFGMTALDMAILNGDVESSAVLVSSGGDPDHLMKMFALSDLYEVLVLGQRKELKDLLLYDENVDVNQPFSRFNITRRNSPDGAAVDTTDEGLTPLTVAVRSNDMNAVKMLLRQGANVNDMGPGEHSPLGEAAAKNDRKVAEVLLQHGANVEDPIPAYNNATPVVVAAFMGSHTVVDLLVRRNAKVDKPMSDGSTSLVKAFGVRDMEMVHRLLRADLYNNFEYSEEKMHQLAVAYQDKDRDVEAILEEVSNWAKEIQPAEDSVAPAEFSPKPIDLDSNANTPARPAPAPPGMAPQRELFKQENSAAVPTEQYQQPNVEEPQQFQPPQPGGVMISHERMDVREFPADQPPGDQRDGRPQVAPVQIIPVAEVPYTEQPLVETLHIQQPPAGEIQEIRQPAAGEVQQIRQSPAGEVQQIRQPAAGEIQHIRQPPAGENQLPQQPVLQTFAAPPAQVQQQKQFVEQVQEGQEDDDDEEEESSEEESSEEDDSEEEDDEEGPHDGEGPVLVQRDVVQTTSTATQQFVTFTEPTPQSPPPPLPSNGPPQEDKPSSRIPVAANASSGTVVTTQTVRTTTVTVKAPGPVPKAVMEDIPDIDDESDEEEALPSGGTAKPADGGGSSKETTL